MNELPFVDIANIRVFDSTIDPNLLQWHWDEQDRLIKPLHKTDWKFQFDNELPIQLSEEVSIFIPVGTWHRLIKGTGSLTISIDKYES